MSSIADSKKQFKIIKSVLESAATFNLNVLLRGESGVGKTHMIMDICKQRDMKLKYFSASTLDPFADLIGIPVPKGDHVEYFRLEEINSAEFMFFDELNRSHKKVMNAVLEIIQFKTLNGDVLPNLRMVWAAINPWEQEGYQTEVLDLALQGRFHFNIDVPYNISYDYFAEKYNDDVAKAAYDWWWNLSDTLRLKFQPRRLDYTIEAMIQNLDYEFTKPFDNVGYVEVPLNNLKKVIELSLATVKLTDILKDTKKYIKIAESGDVKDDKYVDLVRALTNIHNDPKTVIKVLEIVSVLPADYLYKIIFRDNDYSQIRNELYTSYGIEELIKWDKTIQQKINS